MKQRFLQLLRIEPQKNQKKKKKKKKKSSLCVQLENYSGGQFLFLKVEK
jgi:hypothetical protein